MINVPPIPQLPPLRQEPGAGDLSKLLSHRLALIFSFSLHSCISKMAYLPYRELNPVPRAILLSIGKGMSGRKCLLYLFPGTLNLPECKGHCIA